jgi:hypothetical protein
MTDKSREKVPHSPVSYPPNSLLEELRLRIYHRVQGRLAEEWIARIGVTSDASLMWKF